MLELKGIHKYYNPGTVNEMCLFQDFNLTIDQRRNSSLSWEVMVPERLPC